MSGAILVITGERVTYKDIFGESHETTFCLMYIPPHPSENPESNLGDWGACLYTKKQHRTVANRTAALPPNLLENKYRHLAAERRNAGILYCLQI